MKKALLITLLTGLFSGCFAVPGSHYMMVEAHPGYMSMHPTEITVYDYVYDRSSNTWYRVNIYVDYIDCRKTTEFLAELRTSNFYFSVTGPQACPDTISYSVYHDAYYIAGHSYFVWNSHHHSFHRDHIRVSYHNHRSFNKKHRYTNFKHRHVSRSHIKHKRHNKYKVHGQNKHKVYGSHKGAPTSKKSVSKKKYKKKTKKRTKTRRTHVPTQRSRRQR